jgi:uncharacterized protein (DUF1330 family)
MAKGYWVVAYRSIRDTAVLAAYAKLAGPAIEAAGDAIVARDCACLPPSGRRR